MEILKAKGGRKMMKLPVSAPFHSPLMEPAKTAMEPVLKALAFQTPSLPPGEQRGRPGWSPSPRPCGMAWSARSPAPCAGRPSSTLLLKEGVTTFFELGPGKVLSGIAGRLAKEAGVEVKTASLGAPEDMAALLG